MTREQAQSVHQWLVGMGSPPQIAWEEIYYLTDLASSQDLPPGHLLEVGSAWGGSTRLLAVANRDRGRGERMVSVDPVSEYQDTFRTVSRACALASVCRGEPPVHHWAGTAQDLEAVGMGRVFRMTFVDAWHDYEPVLLDLGSAARLTVHGGVICSHDMAHTNNPGAERAWQEVVSRGGIPDEDGIWVPEPGLVHSTGTLRWRAA